MRVGARMRLGLTAEIPEPEGGGETPEMIISYCSLSHPSILVLVF